MTDENPAVSILCATYNHEKYIRQCLEGLVMQKTNFAFEVLINDDASTDHTADVIRAFEEHYPSIIKPIYQSQNQYSKGIAITWEILFPKSKGKYIAFCEGDDYWTDPYKLQKQYEAMEVNPSISVSLHKVGMVNEDGTHTNLYKPQMDFLTGIISREQLSRAIVYPGGYHFMQFHLSSIFVKAEAYQKYIFEGKSLRAHFDVGDLPLLLYMSIISDAFYIDEEMSCYRLGAIESWTTRNRSAEKLSRHCLIEAEGLSTFNEMTEYIYDNSVQMGILAHRLKCADIQGEISPDQYREFLPVIKQLPFRSRVRLLLLTYCPVVLKKYYSIKESQ